MEERNRNLGTPWSTFLYFLLNTSEIRLNTTNTHEILILRFAREKHKIVKKAKCVKRINKKRREKPKKSSIKHQKKKKSENEKKKNEKNETKETKSLKNKQIVKNVEFSHQRRALTSLHSEIERHQPNYSRTHKIVKKRKNSSKKRTFRGALLRDEFWV